tara:strand:+ start:1336 stop:2196 length:861 start_codon:yes stop_codon:yes gene_type:complete
MQLIDRDDGSYDFIRDSGNYINFFPDRGGIITKWILNSENILYFDKSRFKDKNKSIRGGIPILFPICGSLDLQKSLFGNNHLNFVQHGFARDSKWEYKFDKQKNSLKLILRDNQLSIKYFPFSFYLTIDVMIGINSLNFDISIQNNSKSTMPVNFGLHPYFNISDFNNITFISYPLNCQNQKNNNLERTSNSLKNLATGIDLLMYSSGYLLMRDYGFNREIKLVNPSPFDITVIWTEPPRKMICMEPWTSPRNSLKYDFRKILIPPNSQKEFKALIKVNALRHISN